MNGHRNKVRIEAAEWILELESASNENFPLKEWTEWMSESDLHDETFKGMLNLWGIAKLLQETDSKPIN